MLKFTLIPTLLASIIISASEISVNGDFEKIDRSKKIAMPATWYRNNNVTKNAAIELCEEPTLVHTGKTALYIESEPNGRAYVFRSPMIACKARKKLLFSAWIKGSGKVKLGFITHGIKSSSSKTHLKTASSKPFDASEEKYSKISWEYPLPVIIQNGTTYSNYLVMPFIDVHGNAVVFIDNCKIETK